MPAPRRTGVRRALLALAALGLLLPSSVLAASGLETPDTELIAARSGIVLAAAVPSPVAVAPSAAPAAQPRVRRVRVVVTGDVLIHDTVWAAAAAEAAAAGRSGMDFAPMLAPLRSTIAAADLALCHLETPLAPPGGPYQSYPVFAAPPAVVSALVRTGYDGCSTASNHSVDQGFEGIGRTLADLDRAGLTHTGTARTPGEAARSTIITRSGIRIAWLSYTYGTNGIPVEKPFSVDLIDPERILADAHRARTQDHADAVLVALHWGDEYAHSPSAYQLQIADRLTRSPDITMIYGHHAHVVQPIRMVNGRPLIFGLGNLLADQGTVAQGVTNGLIGMFTLVRRGDGPVRVEGVGYRATHIVRRGGSIRVYDIPRALADPDLKPSLRAELLAARAETRRDLGN